MKTIKNKYKKCNTNKRRTARNTNKRRTKRIFRGGELNTSEKLMDLIKRKSMGDVSISNRTLIDLLKDVKNDEELYNAIFDINKKLFTLKNKEDFTNVALELQEDASYELKEFPLCKYGKRCKRTNILHGVSHTFRHPATFIVESINKLNNITFN